MTAVCGPSCRRTPTTAPRALGLGGVGALAATSSAAEPNADAGASFPGTWTYRSFLNIPEIGTDFSKLEFARATVTIEDAPFGVLRGLIRWGEKGDEGLALKGSISYGNPFTARFQGRGDTPSTKDWVDHYLGFLVPMWPDGTDQRPAVIGTVIRTVAHGQSPAGRVASFVMVRRDGK